MKRVTILISKAMIALLVIGLINFNILYTVKATEPATESEETQEGEQSAFVFNPSSSIVQVVLLYVDKNDVKHIVQCGSGVLVNEATVVTNKHLLSMSDEQKIQAGSFLSEQLGYTVTFVEIEPVEGEESTTEEVEVSDLILAISNQNDVYIEATEKLSSIDMDFAVLDLKSKIIDREFPTLGDSSTIVAREAVHVFGFPDMDYTNGRYCSLEELVSNQGKCLYSDENIIKHEAAFSYGTSGGALVDKYGRIVGINTYAGNGENTACPINIIIECLESNGYVYIQNTENLETTEEVVIEEEDYTDKTPLEATIAEAQTIVDAGNDGLYTAESFAKLQEELQNAKDTLAIEDVNQGTLNSAQKELRSAIDGLVKIEKKDKSKLVIIIVIASIVAILMIVGIALLAVKSGKKKKLKKAEEKIKVLERNEMGDVHQIVKTPQTAPQTVQQVVQQMTPQQMASHTPQVSQQMTSLTARASQPMQQMSQVSQGMQQLPQVSNQSTPQAMQQTQGNVQQPVSVQTGYLFRTRTNEAIPITTSDFIVGKSRNNAHYVVDNSNISRTHARIIRANNQFFLQDMGSTNFTILNNTQLTPNTNYNLNANDIIYFADEEFIFIIE